MIDLAGIDAVAALALTTPGHHGETYRLSGPVGLRPADQVALLGAALGRQLVFAPTTDDEAREQMGTRLRRRCRQHLPRSPELEEQVQPTLELLLGRPPGSLSEWLARHVDGFDLDD